MNFSTLLNAAFTILVTLTCLSSQAAEVWQNRFRANAPSADINKIKSAVNALNKALGIENSNLALVQYQSVPRVKQIGSVELIQLISENYEGPTTPFSTSIEITEVKEHKAKASDAILLKVFEGMASFPLSEKAKLSLASAFKGALRNPSIGLFEFSHKSEWGICQGAFLTLKAQGFVAELVNCRKK